MSGQLASYLRRRIGMQTLALLAVLTAMMQLLELLDVTTEILERGLGVSGLLYYAALRLPAEVGLALPLAVLLGTMTVLGGMARNLEIAAMRASGISLKQLLGFLLPLLLVLTLLQFALLQAVLPRFEVELKRWWNASAPAETVKKRLWAHTKDGPVSIDEVSADGLTLQGVRVYAREGGLLTSKVSAASAHWNGQNWELQNITELVIDAAGARRQHEESRAWQTNLSPDEVLRLGLARPNLSTMMIVEVIAGARAGTQPRSYYQTALFRSFIAPFGVCIMLLLALPTAARLPRGNRGGGMLLTLMLGLAYLLSDGIASALGSSGWLPALPTVLAAPLLFTLIGLWRLQWLEAP